MLAVTGDPSVQCFGGLGQDILSGDLVVVRMGNLTCLPPASLQLTEHITLLNSFSTV